MSRKCSETNETCSSVVLQTADVSLPVNLKPLVTVGDISTDCCGQPSISYRHEKTNNCGCEIIITQTVTYRIPIEYGVESHIGTVSSNCKKRCDCNDC